MKKEEFEEAVKKYLIEKLKIDVWAGRHFGGHKIEVKLILDNKVISESAIYA